jgi:putative phosphoesterase
MRVAALYDIHGNLPALEAVLDAVRAAAVDQIVIGGDVLPGPMPRECLDALRSLSVPATFILGNGDRETVAARRGQMSAIIPEYFRASMEWNARQLSAADARAIEGWPPTHRMTIGGLGDVVFCHATPRNDLDVFTEATPAEKLEPIVAGARCGVLVCGHTHMQFDRRVGQTRVVNAGSVGMPFQEPGAYWLLLGDTVELCRTDYDLAAAAERVRATTYPLADEFASKSILAPPSKQSMIEAFANAELR